MARAIEEWRGKTDDTPAPPRVRLRVWERCGGRCHACGRKIGVGEKWTLEHRTALINLGENRESNLCLTCCNCLPDKNAADVAEKSAVYKTRSRHVGIKKKSTFGCARDGKWKRRMDGTTVRR